MKKYFKNNIFYQGDAKIILPLFLVYIITFMVEYIKINEYFKYNIGRRLYNNVNIFNIVGVFDILFLTLYLGIIYIISSGLFKRKKWTTFLSMPYSKLDIRKREFFIIFISLFVYIGIFLLLILKGYIQYYEVIIYLDKFYRIIIIETIRLTSIAFLILGIICIVDTIFSNIYYIVGSILTVIIYFMFFIFNFQDLLREEIIYKNFNIIDLLNIIYDYILGGFREFRLYQVTIIATIFIVISIILIYISKELTDKMLVENMNEGIIFSFPKKVARFIMITLPGLIVSLFMAELIDSYYDYTLSYNRLLLIKIIVIISSTLITKYFISAFRKEFKKKKEIYY